MLIGGLLVVVAFVSVFLLLMNSTGYDTWGALPVGLILFVVSLPIFARQAARERDKRLVFYESVDRLALRFVDCVSPLSPELRDGLAWMGMPERKIRMVMNTVDLEEVDGIAAAVERLAGDTVVGYVGQVAQFQPGRLAAVGRLLVELNGDPADVAAVLPRDLEAVGRVAAQDQLKTV